MMLNAHCRKDPNKGRHACKEDMGFARLTRGGGSALGSALDRQHSMLLIVGTE